MYNYIFLDIDGVVRSYRPKQNKQIQNHIACYFHVDAINHLKKLQEEFQSKIIITSTWRYIYDLNTLKEFFQIFDIYIEDTIKDGNRKDMIQSYIDEHDIQAYIILDDLDLTSTYGFHQIQTNDHFNQINYEHAKKILRRRL